MRTDVLNSLARWAEHGILPGSFLQAVLKNDLRGACERADDENRFALFEIVVHIYNYLPSACWGSPERVEAWRAKHAERRAAERCAEPEETMDAQKAIGGAR